MPSRRPESAAYVRHWRYRRDLSPLRRYVRRIREALPDVLPEQREQTLRELAKIVGDGRTSEAGPGAP